jgi:cbb3-type cytochrome oxidase maturation protein
MSEATIVQTLFSLVIFLIFLGFLIWGIRTRQFRDVEEPKYKIFEDDFDEENEEKEVEE